MTFLLNLVLIYMLFGVYLGLTWCIKHYHAGKAVPSDMPWGYLLTLVVFAVLWPKMLARLEDFK